MKLKRIKFPWQDATERRSNSRTIIFALSFPLLKATIPKTKNWAYGV